MPLKLRILALALLVAIFPQIGFAADPALDIVPETWQTDGESLGEFDVEHADEGHTHARADKHVPAGLMGGHVHGAGEIMFEYKYMNMYMQGNRTGHTRVSTDDAFNIPGGGLFAITPTNMHMEMHMIHLMYGLNDNVTLYMMPTYIENTMDHVRRTGLSGPTPFTTRNSGPGDLPFGAIWKAWEGCTEEVLINIGFSAPTGDLTRRTSIPTGGTTALEYPYPMRLGTGTFDLRPGVTWKKKYEDGSIGAQVQTHLPVGDNFDGYAVGNTYTVNMWAAKLFDVGCNYDNVSASFRVENLWKENYDGFDDDLQPLANAVSTNRPDFRAGYWLNFGYGLTWLWQGGGLLNVELTHPVYQDLEGIQLETDWTFYGSWSKAW